MLGDLQQAYHRWPTQSEAVRRWQEQGKKVFGYMCNHVPEELLYAGGILPVKFLGDGVPIIEANQYQSVFMCYYGRSLLEIGLQGAYRNLDGMVSAYGCEGGCNLFQVLVETVPVAYSQFISIPHNAKNTLALNFFTQELLVMKRSLEEYLGKEITPADLRKAIDVYNENRRLLRQVYDIRGLPTRPRLTGVEVAELMNWVMEVPKEEANGQLKKVLESGNTRLMPAVTGPRIHISGSILLDQEIFQLVEDLGGMVVSDDLCSGSRYFWEDVRLEEVGESTDTSGGTGSTPGGDNAAPGSESLIEALARHKLNRIPCSCMCSPFVAEERVEHIMQLVNRYRVDGVIFAVHKWCDSHQMDRPFMIHRLQELGLPVLSIDVERGLGDAQARTRIESFVEMIGGNKHVHQD